MESTWKAAVAEFVATFALVFVGAGAVITALASDSGLVGVALAHGVVLAVMVSVTGHISGGLVNPAVTIGLWVVGKLSTYRAGVFIAAQLAGAIVGAFVLRLAVPGELFGSAAGGATLLNEAVDVGHGILIEAVLTFFLVFAVFGTAIDDRGPFGKTAGLTIGLVLVFDILMGGPYTGASMNPARTLGPGLVSGNWADWWVYWVGPIAGAVVAALLYWGVFLRSKEPATP